MEKFDLNNIFQGISTLLQSDPSIMYARIGLILLGILLVYLGRRGILEPLVMIPMGLGMAAVNAGVLITFCKSTSSNRSTPSCSVTV